MVRGPGSRKPVLRLEWAAGESLAIARDAYDSRRWGLLPVLADCLEDIGCTRAGLLAHLRDTRPHARGCWALDAILGKE